MPFFLKMLAPALMALGSIILAVRMKQILDALARAIVAAEEYRLQIVEHLVNKAPLTATTECGSHIRDCRRIRVGVLVAGFLLIAMGALISGFNVYTGGL